MEKERRNVTLYCNATGRPTAQLSWVRVRDGNTVAFGNTLMISAADRSHRGEYRCIADNGVGNPVSTSVYIDVLCKFRNTAQYFFCICWNQIRGQISTVYVSLQFILSFFVDNPSSTRLTTDKLNAVVSGNGRIALSCVTDANPPPSQYQLYHDGVYLRSSLTGIHVIQKARYFDAGTYLCVPLNSLGTGTNSSVQVYVNGE